MAHTELARYVCIHENYCWKNSRKRSDLKIWSSWYSGELHLGGHVPPKKKKTEGVAHPWLISVGLEDGQLKLRLGHISSEPCETSAVVARWSGREVVEFAYFVT